MLRETWLAVNVRRFDRQEGHVWSEESDNGIEDIEVKLSNYTFVPFAPPLLNTGMLEVRDATSIAQQVFETLVLRVSVDQH